MAQRTSTLPNISQIARAFAALTTEPFANIKVIEQKTRPLNLESGLLQLPQQNCPQNPEALKQLICSEIDSPNTLDSRRFAHMAANITSALSISLENADIAQSFSTDNNILTELYTSLNDFDLEEKEIIYQLLQKEISAEDYIDWVYSRNKPSKEGVLADVVYDYLKNPKEFYKLAISSIEKIISIHQKQNNGKNQRIAELEELKKIFKEQSKIDLSTQDLISDPMEIENHPNLFLRLLCRHTVVNNFFAGLRTFGNLTFDEQLDFCVSTFNLENVLFSRKFGPMPQEQEWKKRTQEYLSQFKTINARLRDLKNDTIVRPKNLPKSIKTITRSIDTGLGTNLFEFISSNLGLIIFLNGSSEDGETGSALRAINGAIILTGDMESNSDNFSFEIISTLAHEAYHNWFTWNAGSNNIEDEERNAFLFQTRISLSLIKYFYVRAELTETMLSFTIDSIRRVISSNLNKKQKILNLRPQYKPNSDTGSAFYPEPLTLNSDLLHNLTLGIREFLENTNN